jgi:hypothetical protein
VGNVRLEIKGAMKINAIAKSLKIEYGDLTKKGKIGLRKCRT